MLTAETLRQLLDYDPETGVFTWKMDRGHRVKSGQRAGAVNGHGYVMINVNWRQYPAHRLAWLYANKTWPTNQIDHINGDRADNRLVNLREATVAQNAHNRKAPTTNRSGFKGVSWNTRRNQWCAEITVNGKRYFLGYFKSPEEGHVAYSKAAAQHQREYARTF